jgi:hypothetical protein
MSVRPSPALFFVSILACSIPAGLLAAETTSPPNPRAGAQTSGQDRPFIVHNPDGTMTVQKARASGKADTQKGLVIPPQVVAPTMRTPAKERGN